MQVDVVPVESKSQLKQFIEYPHQLYKNEAAYVPALDIERNEFFDTEKNPFYKGAKVQLFLAVRGHVVCGRIATCVNYRHNDFHGEKTGFFGFLDCPDDYEIASRLLKVAMITLKKEGMETMRGPMNFSTNHEIGFLVENFEDPPQVMMTWNKPYLPALAEKFGLKKVMDLLGFYIDEEALSLDRHGKVTKRLLERQKITIRTIRMNDFDNEVKLINRIYNEAWERNWGFVPMELEEFNYMAKNLKELVDPKLVIIAMHGERPVGFCLALPDINQALIHTSGHLLPFGLFQILWHTKVSNKVNRLRMITMGVVHDYHKKGVDAALYVHTAQAGMKAGYVSAELSWILETNELMVAAATALGCRLYKRYRIMQMPI